MRFECETHGELDRVTVDGYILAHYMQGLTPREVEGITVSVEAPEDGDLAPEHVSADEESYLERFADWRRKAAAAFDKGDAIDLGLECPECGSPETVRMVRPA